MPFIGVSLFGVGTTPALARECCAPAYCAVDVD